MDAITIKRMVDGYFALDAGYVPHIGPDCSFPPISSALTAPNGLLAIGGTLTRERLIEAYRQGIFPWFSDDEPIMWWSPNPRMVLMPDALKVARSLKKTINKQLFEIRFDTAFEAVIRACAQATRPEQDGTWITQEMVDAYCDLHQHGHAHCVEAWQDDKLVGGCYGVKIGRMFYGESMFHHVSEASKVAFVAMVEKLRAEGIGMIDCQMNTAHLARFGAIEIARDEFQQRLAKLV